MMYNTKTAVHFEIDGNEIYYTDFVEAWQRSITTREVLQRLDVKDTPRNRGKLGARASKLRRNKIQPIPLKKFRSSGNKSKLTKEDYKELMQIVNSIE
jgi:hypothetical protein